MTYSNAGDNIASIKNSHTHTKTLKTELNVVFTGQSRIRYSRDNVRIRIEVNTLSEK